MGMYVDPNNENFTVARNSRMYVEKSGLIAYTNSILGGLKNKICVTRPRRFGKTMAYDMLAAYYSCGCDSAELFQGLRIAQDPSFLQHLNKHHVIRFDMQFEWRSACDLGKEEHTISLLQKDIINELLQTFPEYSFPEAAGLAKTINFLHNKNNTIRFVFLIDEWDVLFRNPKVS